MMRDASLALGLLLTTASQLRPGTSPVGAGELLLLAWSLATLLRCITSGTVLLPPALSLLLIFWGLFTFAECLGLMTGYALDIRTDPQWVLHDILAYPLVATVSCLSALETAPRLRRITWILVGSGAVALIVQLAAATGAFRIPPMEPWYWERFRGWSANPNQLAFLCAALCLASLHLADTASNRSEFHCAVICGAIPLITGHLTGSDTFTLMLLASGVVFIILKLGTWWRSPAAMSRPRFAFTLLLAIAIPTIGTSLLPAAWSMSDDAGDLAMGLMKNGGKEAHEEADLRFALWRQAIVKGIEAGTLGLGPGPHLAIPASLVSARASEAGQPGNIQHPQNNGLPNFEAHNTILDLFVQGGLLADISFIWLVCTALLYSYRGRMAGLTTLLGSLTFFGMTNLIIRQPLFWFAIVSCLAAGAPQVLKPVQASLRPVKYNHH